MTMSHHPVSRLAAAGGFVLLYTYIKNMQLYTVCMYLHILYIHWYDYDARFLLLCDMIVFVGWVLIRCLCYCKFLLCQSRAEAPSNAVQKMLCVWKLFGKWHRRRARSLIFLSGLYKYCHGTGLFSVVITSSISKLFHMFSCQFF